MTAQEEVDDWNNMNRQGCEVAVRQPSGSFMTRTRSEAFVAASGHAVIFCEKISGFVRLSFVARRVPA